MPLNLHNIISGLVDILYPKTCLVCKKRLTDSSVDNLVCFACWGKIKKNLPPFCHRCGRQLSRKNLTKSICADCVKKTLHFDRAFSPCIYEGAVKELIHQFKYKNKDYLGSTLSKLMIDFIKEYELPINFIDFIIPVPLHKTRLREREYNQAQILSNHIAREFKKMVSNDILIRNRYTKTQTELEPEKRLSNVKNSFSVTHNDVFKGKNLLLVDDVLTTGSTVSEAAYALKNFGANIVFVLTLAS
jgi:ComF family protein